ncbi:hypothetical protein A2955_02585 [Candidatus Woesebacteria bacterium RIFCSPLOWO2_01_FULL_37_19]|uniref:Uncharacterized protein n=2 Tax=Candidatus Woeseibacteriota TaxID=1752722 RepID=A0A1F8AYF6_9BACT|nr:MAG: hypothetical protein A2771_04050 [Candidatus Woesebacteria bacterium RIFCSPHIGHO2_01_FULL_38_26b]OGM56794.1 MAG: hypothetical protein A2955_02585 [Candidatus Woesebacteria bacterium RIFCSPLOWO2_01_FULL_37_19]
MEKLAVSISNSFFGGNHFLNTLPGVSRLVSILLSNAIAIAGILFLFILVFAGIQMISGAGKSPQEVARGREIILAAIIGLIIIFLSFWIVRIVARSTGLTIL